MADPPARADDHTLDVIKQIGSIHLEGNIIPHEWYKHLRHKDGKPNTVAVIILSEIVYWYRPGVEKDERTGRVLRYYKRFKADKLQRSHGSFAEQFGFTKRQVRSAIDYLEEQGIITTELRTVPVAGGMPMSNVLYIEVVPEALRRICLPCDMYVTVYAPQVAPLDTHVSPSVHASQTYTEITPETTTEIEGYAPAIASAPPAPEPKAERKATGGNAGNRRISAPTATRLQIDTLPDDWRAYVDDKRPDLSADALFEDFSDYWRAQPGQKGIKSDWPATWRRWVRESTAKPHLLRQQAQAVGQRPDRIDLGPYADWVRRTKATLETTDPRYQELVKIQQRRYMTADEFRRLQPQAREVQYV